MNKILDVAWLIFIVLESFILFITFCYLRREYIKAIEESNENKRKIKTYIIEKKDIAIKNIIKMNKTEIIDVQEIKKQLEYVQLIFLLDGNYIGGGEISNEKIRIGRDPRNDIVINNRTVSRKQCLIVKENNTFILKNYSYANKTRLNGKIVKKSKEIKYGDVVKIGNISFTFDSVTKAG